jgi:polysaccharide export outer membrane protein
MPTKLRDLFFYAIIITLLSSCAARKERSLFNAKTDIITDTISKVYVVNDHGMSDVYYKIKINDFIAIKNVQNKEFGATNTTQTGTGATLSNTQNGVQYANSFQVEPDGKVNLPAIGKVEIAGLTRKEAALKVQTIYAENLLKDPIIELSLVNLKVTLLGEFNKQGNFFLEKDNVNLIDIIGEAGGISKNADPKTLKIIRGDRANPEIIYVNLGDINSLASKKLILQNNDIIYIQGTKNSALTDKLQGFNNILQPLLVVVNLGVLIFTLTR